MQLAKACEVIQEVNLCSDGGKYWFWVQQSIYPRSTERESAHVSGRSGNSLGTL